MENRVFCWIQPLIISIQQSEVLIFRAQTVRQIGIEFCKYFYCTFGSWGALKTARFSALKRAKTTKSRVMLYRFVINNNVPISIMVIFIKINWRRIYMLSYAVLPRWCCLLSAITIMTSPSFGGCLLVSLV